MTVSDRYPMEELLPVVARLAAKYSSGSSTSVTMERAQQLMEAVLYCIRENEHLCEKSGSDEKNLQNSRNMTAQEAYENGYRMVLEKTDRARNLYHELIQNFTDYGNQSLHDTVILGIPAFFRYYDAEIDPQNQILTLDYPTIWPVGELCGVDAIYHYLKCLRMEQMFLDGIPDETVKKILEAYCADYRE